jgi:hypothetical protein
MEWFTEPVWLGNYIIARWASLAFVGGTIVVAVVTSIIAIGLIVAMIKWLVNPTAKPGKQ